MAKDVFIIKMVDYMMVNGNITKCQEKANYIINQVHQHMMGYGKMINSKVKANFVINLHNNQHKHILILILMELDNIGYFMKVNNYNNLGDFKNDMKEGRGKLMLKNG